MSSSGPWLPLPGVSRTLFAAAIFWGLLVWSTAVQAQACCAAASAIAPGRLSLHEQSLIGLQPSVAATFGSFASDGAFFKAEDGASQVDVTTTLFATTLLAKRLQVGVTVPILASVRRSNSVGTERGGGMGDFGMNFRYDVLRNRERRYFPGIGIIAGGTAPTGRAAEESQKLLSSDVTGLGVFQGSLGLWLEQSAGNFLFTGAGWVSARSARNQGGVHSQLAPQFSGLLSVGYSPSEIFGFAVSATFLGEGNARVDHETVAGSGRRQTRLSLSGSLTATDTLRFLASGFFDPPVFGLGKNQVAQAGGVATLIVSFL